MQSTMQLNQGSKQHFNLSKASLNKKNVKHTDPKTHRRTLNKSNQFYISKTSSMDQGSCRGAIEGTETFSIDPPSY